MNSDVPSSPVTSESLTLSIRAILDPKEKTRDLVREYFDIANNRNFAGATFDNFGPPETEAEWNGVTDRDLLALCMLDVRPRPEAIRQLRSEEFKDVFQALPRYTPIWEAEDSELQEIGAAWGKLAHVYYFGPTSISKILARKRPHLVPIQDSVIERLLNIPKDSSWHPALGAALEDDVLRSGIDNLWTGGNEERPSTLRLLDVALWTLGSNSRVAATMRNRYRGLEDPFSNQY